MPEPTERLPATDDAQKLNHANEGDAIMDPQEVVYKGGYVGNPKDIVENPAATPEMLNEPGDLRDDLMEED